MERDRIPSPQKIPMANPARESKIIKQNFFMVLLIMNTIYNQYLYLQLELCLWA